MIIQNKVELDALDNRENYRRRREWENFNFKDSDDGKNKSLEDFGFKGGIVRFVCRCGTALFPKVKQKFIRCVCGRRYKKK